MAQPDEDDDLRAELVRRLLADPIDLPTSALGRLGRTGLALFRGSRLIGQDEEPIDVEALTRLVASAGQLKGLSMKAGQLMSYVDLALPEQLREALSVLQTHAQPMTFDQVCTVLDGELGSRGAVLVDEMDPEPIAAASIGQVHRSRVPQGERVAVKVQYPGIEDAIRSDFRSAKIGPKIAQMVYPGAPVEAFVDEAEARVLEECDYEREARMQTTFAEIYADHEVIEIPEVYPDWCTRRVLTTQFVDAEGFEAFLAQDPPQRVRDRIGEALFEFYVGTLFGHEVYNCDPHPGNYLFPDDETVAILDHGCARSFDPEFVDELSRLSTAARRGDEEALRQVLVDLDVIDGEDEEAFATARRFVSSFYGPVLDNRVQQVDLETAIAMQDFVASKRELMRLSLPGAFLFLLRIRFGLFSVLARLGARANWHALEERYVEARG